MFKFWSCCNSDAVTPVTPSKESEVTTIGRPVSEDDETVPEVKVPELAETSQAPLFSNAQREILHQLVPGIAMQAKKISSSRPIDPVDVETQIPEKCYQRALAYLTEPKPSSLRLFATNNTALLEEQIAFIVKFHPEINTTLERFRRLFPDLNTEQQENVRRYHCHAKLLQMLGCKTELFLPIESNKSRINNLITQAPTVATDLALFDRLFPNLQLPKNKPATPDEAEELSSDKLARAKAHAYIYNRYFKQIQDLQITKMIIWGAEQGPHNVPDDSDTLDAGDSIGSLQQHLSQP